MLLATLLVTASQFNRCCPFGASLAVLPHLASSSCSTTNALSSPGNYLHSLSNPGPSPMNPRDDSPATWGAEAHATHAAGVARTRFHSAWRGAALRHIMAGHIAGGCPVASPRLGRGPLPPSTPRYETARLPRSTGGGVCLPLLGLALPGARGTVRLPAQFAGADSSRATYS